MTGKKEQQLVFRSHSMFPGGLKEVKYQNMMARRPDEVHPLCPFCSISCGADMLLLSMQIIRHAVSGMLPKNKLRDRRLERLRIFEDDNMGVLEKNILKRWEDGTLR